MNPQHPQFIERADQGPLLNVLSVFLTVDGEANSFHVGTWSVFVRLTGCRVGCTWCDTKYSWSIKQGQLMDVGQILFAIDEHSKGASKITITGGEPLEQDGPALVNLVERLVEDRYYVSIETAGTLPARHLDIGGVCLVFDWKLRSSGAASPHLPNYRNLGPGHVVKFVISSREDFHEAVLVAEALQSQMGCKARLVFSPCGGKLTPQELFQWMKNSDCPGFGVGFNLQSHKYIFSDDFRDEEGSGEFYGRESGRPKAADR